MTQPNLMTNLLLAFAIVAISAGAAMGNELAINGSFETGDFTGWEQFPSGTQTIGGFDPTDGLFAVELNNNVPGSASVIKNSNIGIAVVNPGDMLRVSFDARGATNVGGVAFAEFFSEIDGGGTSASEILGGGPLAISANPAEWTSFVFDVTAGPDVSGGVSLQLTATTGGDPSSSAQIFYDNVSVSIAKIPEPTSCAIIGMGLFGMAVRRRR